MIKKSAIFIVSAILLTTACRFIFSYDLIPYRDGDKWGYCDANKKIVIPVNYEDAGFFREGLAFVKNASVVDVNGITNGGLYGYIDKSGAVIVPFIYNDAYSFYDSLAGVVSNGKWGFIDRTGRQVVPLTYDYEYAFTNGLAKVNQFGSYDDKLYAVIGGKWGFIDTNGNVVVPVKYDAADDFSGGLALVNMGGTFETDRRDIEGGKWGFVDMKGKVIVQLKYDKANDFKEGLAGVCVNHKGWGFIDTKGRVVISLKYAEARDFSEGLAVVAIDTSSASNPLGGHKYGYINKNGRVTIPIKYDQAVPFSEGIGCVYTRGNIWAGTASAMFIDKTGRELFTFGTHKGVYPFSEGFAKIRSKDGNMYYLVDKNGKEVAEYDRIGEFIEGMVWVGKKDPSTGKNSYGFLNSRGEEAVHTKYEDEFNFEDGLARVEIDGKWGVIDTNGNEYWK